MVIRVEAPMPNTTVVASGRWTSEPAPVARATGRKPKRRDRAGGQHGAHRMHRSLDQALVERVALLERMADVGR